MSDDRAQRLRALNPTKSFIVQAPAGSGKTELLIQRYLKLLATVDTPESIVAITFTKKAAGEMRARIVDALQRAASGQAPDTPHRRDTYDLALRALARDSEAGWRLRSHPARMRIQTIDSLCMSITRQMPWLAGFGASPEVTEKATALYTEAARNTLRQAEQEELNGCTGPLSTLLLHLDNDFSRAERLMTQMLEKRDQWLRHTGAGTHANLTSVRSELEATLAKRVTHQLAALYDALPEEAGEHIQRLLNRNDLPPVSSEGLAEWVRLSDLLLTQKGELRKNPPSDIARVRWNDLIQLIGRDEQTVARLKEIRRLPPVRFDESQWKTLEALIVILPQAAAHLQLVFREHGRTDFAELSIRASAALGHLDNPSDLSLALGHSIQHLLVDEFQDTSFTQYDLLAKLTSGWEPDDGRSLFLVGDPMQSIYRFREADVGLFLRARHEGIGAVQLEPLTLSANFRSSPAIVDWVNQTFTSILPAREDMDIGAVPYSASSAARPPSNEDVSPQIYPFIGESQEAEAERIVELIEFNRGKSIAVLVRARSHLFALIRALRQRRIPFQAIEIDQLGERPAVQDLMALTFALLHPGDRISWLAVLRAPWCGLTLDDLHTLAGGDQQGTIWDLLRRNSAAFSTEGRARVERCLPALESALLQRGRSSLRQTVEEAWLRLGGPATLGPQSTLDDAASYFDLLESLEEGGDLPGFDGLRSQVAELFGQPDPRSDGRLQVMTIHKAKGLEFDVVILPALGARARPEDSELLLFQEQQGDLLLSPMGGALQEQDPLYDYLRRLGREKERQESARLLYVAATRAREQLHLFGCAKLNAKEGVVAEAGSFLRMLWPAVNHAFREVAVDMRAPHPTGIVEKQAPVRELRRLAPGWKLPAAPQPVCWRRAVLSSPAAPEISYEWASDTARLAGTVLHEVYARIAAEGVDRWNPARVTELRANLTAMLANAGVSQIEMPDAAARVQKALIATLRSERGRWLLAPHAEAESECELTGVIEGAAQHVKIDRTFIDEQGVRWIVDFKTGIHEGGSIENHVESEKQRYAPQLELYARLMAQKDERPIRLALYFPLMDEWREWAAPTMRRRQASLFE